MEEENTVVELVDGWPRSSPAAHPPTCACAFFPPRPPPPSPRQVSVEIPLVALADGVHSRSFAGCGVVVHHSQELGLVLVDRNTVGGGLGRVGKGVGGWQLHVGAGEGAAARNS